MEIRRSTLLVAGVAIDHGLLVADLHARRFAPFGREVHALLRRTCINKRAGRRGVSVADGIQVFIAECVELKAAEAISTPEHALMSVCIHYHVLTHILGPP